MLSFYDFILLFFKVIAFFSLAQRKEPKETLPGSLAFGFPSAFFKEWSVSVC